MDASGWRRPLGGLRGLAGVARAAPPPRRGGAGQVPAGPGGCSHPASASSACRALARRPSSPNAATASAAP
eukprot:14637429-Alexandrium_andersonii.AAC.1